VTGLFRAECPVVPELGAHGMVVTDDARGGVVLALHDRPASGAMGIQRRHGDTQYDEQRRDGGRK
jgi:hypothetical protein